MPEPIVLYVEDEPDDVLLMQLAFEREGIGAAFQSVDDGKRAMKYLAGQNGYGDRERYPLPTLVLLDLHLPVVSGFEVLKWIRHLPELGELAVVVFSSSTLPEDKTRAKELGANEFIEKPPSARGFREVAHWLRERWLEESRK